MIPTLRLYGLLAVGAIAAIAYAILDTSPTGLNEALSLMLLWDGALLLLGIADSLLARSRRVTVTRQPLDRLSVGRENHIYLDIASTKSASIRIFDDHPAELDAPKLPLAVQLPANHSDRLDYLATPTRRGEVQWGDIFLRQLGPLGLVWHPWRVKQSCTAVVFPDLIGLRELSVKLAIQSTGSLRRARRLVNGTEFAELREYNRGDDPRLIDWKATARRSVPLVRVLEPEQEQSIIVLLDRGRLMTARTQGLSRFDWGLNATLSLALAALHRGDRVGIGVFDRDMHVWIPPERGRARFPRIVQTLAPIQPVLLEPDYLDAVSTAVNQQTRRALVVVITDLIDTTASEELLAALSRLTPRYLPFCVTLRDPQVDECAHKPAIEPEAGYARAVALDLIHQRELAFAQLKRKGVLVLDTPANRMSEALVDRYLLLKAKGRL